MQEKIEEERYHESPNDTSYDFTWYVNLPDNDPNNDGKGKNGYGSAEDSDFPEPCSDLLSNWRICKGPHRNQSDDGSEK